jgi:pilus assembly protein CpaE
LVCCIEHYPPEAELHRLLRSLSPQAVFVSVEDLQAAVEVSKDVEAHAPGTQVLALGETSSQQVLLEMMRAGGREFLQAPFERDVLQAAIRRATEASGKVVRAENLTEHVYSFLPSKAGVGTTTIALNLSVALSRLPDTRVMLADFDLNSGLIGFMLKLDNRYSVMSAAENAFRLDDNLWRQLVSSFENLDVLPSGEVVAGFRIEPAQIRSIVDFARRQYKAVCFDLSGNLEKYSVELMRASARIFLVCTAELPSLHLAREKVNFLHNAEMSDRVHVVLNRSTKRDVVSPAEIEGLLGVPVGTILPNDYCGIHQALASGKPLADDGELGRRLQVEAAAIMNKHQAAGPSRRRLSEYFSLLLAGHPLQRAEKT